MPSFAPRKRSSRTPPNFSANNNNNNNNTALTTNINEILLQQQQNMNNLKPELNIINFNDIDTIKHIEIQHSSTSPTLSFTTGTTESLDFGDCLSINSDDHHHYSPIPSLWADEIMDSCDLASIATLNTSLSSSTSSNSTTTDNPSLLCTPNSSPIHTMTPSQLIDDSFLFKNDSFDFSLLDSNMLIPPIMFNDDDEHNNNQMVLPSVTVTNFNNNNTDSIDFNSFDQDLMLKMEESANLFSLF